jgi:NAD+ synthase
MTKESLSINTKLVEQILVSFLKTEISRAGFSRGVVGLSGGVDSSLACALAVKALGAENVLGVRMPYRTSSEDSLRHAEMIIQHTGIVGRTFPITKMVDAYLKDVDGASEVRKGNVMARSRMTVLYDQSAAFEGLVIGTGNKTEILLGYTTLYGDSACALNPLGDLYKTQVRQLARAISIPDEIIEKPPSADLWEGQTDEGELGFTYEEVDRLLVHLVDGRYSKEDCIGLGFAPDFVERVMRMVQRNHFKRVLPPIAKLSHRTVGYDFLYLRDWGT